MQVGRVYVSKEGITEQEFERRASTIATMVAQGATGSELSVLEHSINPERTLAEELRAVLCKYHEPGCAGLLNEDAIRGVFNDVLSEFI